MQHSSKKTGVPPHASVLQRLYPEITTVKARSLMGTRQISRPHLVTALTPPTLQDVLLKLVTGTPLESQLTTVLIQPGDPSTYRDGTLLQCLCAVNATAPVLRSRFTLQQHSSQAEVISWDSRPPIARKSVQGMMAVCWTSADHQ